MDILVGIERCAKREQLFAVAARLATRHRVATHETQATFRGRCDDRPFGAGHVRDDRAGFESPAQPVPKSLDQRQCARRRRGEDDQVRAFERFRGRGCSQRDDAVGGGPPWAVPGRAPRGDGPGIAVGGLRERAGQRPADQSEAEDCHAHLPSIAVTTRTKRCDPVLVSGDGSGEADPPPRRRRSQQPRSDGVSPDAKPIRVLLVDDHQLLTGSLAQILDREPDIEVAGIASTVEEAKALARERMDVVLMDYKLPDGTGADATRAIKARWPTARVVMLTALNDDETVLESIQAGADGYLTKDRAVEDVVEAVRAANMGETLLPHSVLVGIAERVVAARDKSIDRRQVEPLTPRELEVLRALTEGLSTPEICERLFIAPNTLRTHVQNIMGKLRVHSKLEAVAFAIRHRLVEPPRPEGSLY